VSVSGGPAPRSRRWGSMVPCRMRCRRPWRHGAERVGECLGGGGKDPREEASVDGMDLR
jgi:hypothetical protein